MSTAVIRIGTMMGRTGPSANAGHFAWITRSACMQQQQHKPAMVLSRQFTRATKVKSTKTTASSAPAPTPTPTPTLAKEPTMDWNTYFAVRARRRNFERVFMAPCALLGFGSAGYYFSQKDFDPTPIFGMDQVIVYALGTFAAGIVGLAMGPVVGNMIFRAANSKALPFVDRMDKEFYKHIVKNRADPSANSARNPLPDHFGEKIKSVSDYRKWLRKQREFRRKSQFFIGMD